MGITSKGKDAEELFIKITGAIEIADKARGDCNLDGNDVEVKFADGGTANQVRACKYIPLVVLSNEQWYVVPPNEIVAIAQYRAGQHGKNSFENLTITVSVLASRGFKTDRFELKQAVLAAVATGNKYPRLKAVMLDIPVQTKALANSQKELVCNVLREETNQTGGI